MKIPAAGQYGMMSYTHQGKQYVVVQIGGAQYPGSLVALTLPERNSVRSAAERFVTE